MSWCEGGRQVSAFAMQQGKPLLTRPPCRVLVLGQACWLAPPAAMPTGHHLDEWCYVSRRQLRTACGDVVTGQWVALVDVTEQLLPILHPGAAPRIRAARPLATLHHSLVLSAPLLRRGLTGADGAPACGARPGGHSLATHNALIGNDQAVQRLRCAFIHYWTALRSRLLCWRAAEQSCGAEPAGHANRRASSPLVPCCERVSQDQF